MVAGLLPAGAAVLLAALARSRQPGRGWLDAILTAAICVTALIVLSTEFLGLFGAVRFGALAGLWVLVDLGLAFALSRGGFARELLEDLRSRLTTWRTSPWAIGLTGLAAATLVIVLCAPPNTWDSMTYHLARVAHWHQQGSLDHYPTGILRQLHLGPGAEMIILQLQALVGGDRLAGCVQWAAYGSCAVTAMLIARELGAGRFGERFAALFVMTVPMAVLQSTSTQNDLVTAAWLSAFALYGLRWSRGGDRAELWRAAVALGLAVLTKGTAFLFAAPFIAWFTVAALHRRRARSWMAAVLAVVAVLGLNGGHFLRNLEVYDHPMGSGVEGPEAYASEVHSPGSLISGVTRNLALQLATPYPGWNRKVTAAVYRLHRALKLDPNDHRTVWQGFRFDLPPTHRHEDSEGSPLHLLVLAATLAAAVAAPRLRPLASGWGPYLIATLTGAVLFAFLLRWQPWHARLHLPIWVLAAPFVAAVVDRLSWRPWRAVISLVLLSWAVPLVLHGSPRPLIGEKSVLVTPRADLYFVNHSALQAEYEAVARRAADLGDERLGLRLAGNDWEYPLWVLLGPGTELVHVGVENESALLVSRWGPELRAVICTDAEARAELDTDPAWRRTVGGEIAALYERRSGGQARGAAEQVP